MLPTYRLILDAAALEVRSTQGADDDDFELAGRIFAFRGYCPKEALDIIRALRHWVHVPAVLTAVKLLSAALDAGETVDTVIGALCEVEGAADVVTSAVAVRGAA